VNIDPSRSFGNLNAIKLNTEMMIKPLLERLISGDYSEKGRSRMKVRIFQEAGTTESLSLNEVFTAEADVGHTSTFALRVDNQVYEQFKSSGIIISTGTGSTGWLYSAKSLDFTDISKVAQILGIKDIPDAKKQEIRREVNSHIPFPVDSNQVYYYVKDITGFQRDFRDLNEYQGFCNVLECTSHCMNSKVIIDGFDYHDFPLGTKFEASIAPENTLKCISFS